MPYHALAEGGDTPGTPSGYQVGTFTVPEPSAYALIFGAISLFWVMRRR